MLYPRQHVGLLIFLLYLSQVSLGQSNYVQGVNAFEAEEFQDAITFLTKAVTIDKYEISGKELSLAYAYLALIRTAHLDKNFGNYTIPEIQDHHGNINLAIDEMSNALHFQNNASKSLVKKAADQLAEISLKAANTILDTLVTLKPEISANTIQELAHFIIYEFERLEKITGESWELENALGIAHYYVNEGETALSKFEKARGLFSALAVKPMNFNHLLNYEFSAEYLFDTQKDNEQLVQLLDEGIDYVEHMLTDFNEGELHGVKELTKKEIRFQSIKSKILENK